MVRNDALQSVQINDFDKIVLSPGPGLPSEANQMPELISKYIGEIPILGVCLGFQAIIENLKGKIFNQKLVKHGVQEKCLIVPNSRFFANIPESINIGLYHSWAALESDFPVELNITARSENGVIMAFEHQELPICGVQFHPESILTEHGKQMVENFLTKF